ncbi:hypothetical protein [Oceanospirillum beijerinckii]|uniref:hypothetical protein n=1 Tax=Oceanospirillum beijerinckii TaxID=64976 RepID=UPI00047F1A8B|nr:hypothetical protein [Oceanospirillum beijerinckii]
MTTLNPCPACDSELPTHESSRETQQSCINNRVLAPLEPARSISGYWIHPTIQASYTETTSIAELIIEASEGELTGETILFEEDAIPPHWNQYIDGTPAESFAAIHNWHPKSTHPNGFLVALYNDENTGPTAIFAVPEEHIEKEDTQ